MKRPARSFRNLVLTAVGILMLALALAAASTSPARAGATASSVVVTNTGANPVPVTGAVGISGSAAVNLLEDSTGLTHMRQLPSQHVTLMNTECSPTTECDFIQIHADSTTANGLFRIPAGQVLVITQVDWIVRTGVPGTTYKIPLRVNGGLSETLFGIADANGIAGGTLPLHGGLVAKENPQLTMPNGPITANASPTLQLQVVLLGYLLADR